jgi:hypothetical protein
MTEDLKATWYSIDQPGPSYAGAVTLRGSTLEIIIAALDLTYEATLSSDTNALTGTLFPGRTLGPRRTGPLPLKLVRTTTETAWVIPPTPSVQQIFSLEEIREDNLVLGQMMERVQRVLDMSGRRVLTAEQKDKVEQIHDFLTRAKQARVRDLVTAVGLAKNADLMAKDLLDNLP